MTLQRVHSATRAEGDGFARRRLLASLLALLWPSSRRADALEQSVVVGEDPWPLAVPVSLDRERLEQPWQPLEFDAWFDLPSGTGSQPRELLLKGFLMRVGESSSEGGIHAYCRLCPHDSCWVDLRDRAPMVRRRERDHPDHPLFVCPCHASVFDPAAGGALLSGPAARGLYRFEWRASGDELLVTDIERAALQE